MDGGLKVRLEGSSRMKVGARKEGETPRHEGERAILCSFLSEGGHWEKWEWETCLKADEHGGVCELGRKR